MKCSGPSFYITTQVEPSEVLDECDNDYLEVSDDEPLTRKMRYCGTFTGIRLLEMGESGKKFRSLWIN